MAENPSSKQGASSWPSKRESDGPSKVVRNVPAGYHMRERSSGSFERTFQVPEAIDLLTIFGGDRQRAAEELSSADLGFTLLNRLSRREPRAHRQGMRWLRYRRGQHGRKQ
jgi:hypothetical protein